MPSGNTTWPSWWFQGPNWPNNGEIDVLEGVYGMNYNLISLHTGNNCTMQQNYSTYFNGTWVDSGNKPYLSCYQYANSTNTTNQGCSVEAPKGTFQDAFNAAGGGVFALQWDRNNYIRVWNFINPNIPDDIKNNSTNPNPDTWGIPSAHIPLGSNCSPSHFNNLSMTFDIAFCGGWASQYVSGGEAACENVLLNDPSQFSEAYWLINYVKVFGKPGDSLGTYYPTCQFAC
uniref:GH16 domain-containing protein n=1 Tax=Acrobeloides nanus TaxID=290746 RepID=A0A914DP19_9BILA